MSAAGWMDGCLPAWLLFHCTRAMYVTIFFNRIKYQPLKDAIIIFLFIMKQTTRSGGSLALAPHRLCFFILITSSSQHRAHDVFVLRCSEEHRAVQPSFHRRQTKTKFIYYTCVNAFKPLLSNLLLCVAVKGIELKEVDLCIQSNQHFDFFLHPEI
jgi:hypothetical protein